MAELFIELFSEEIPAKLQIDARQKIKQMIDEKLQKKEINFKSSKTFSTPKRLVFFIEGIPEKIEQKKKIIKGPNVDAPQTALEGFIKSNNLSKLDIYKKNLEKGEFYFAEIKPKVIDILKELQSIIPEALQSYSWKKSMKWSVYDLSWGRPLKSIIALFNNKVINFNFFHLQSSNLTFIDGANEVKVKKVNNYKSYLTILESEKVVLNQEKRKSIIIKKMDSICNSFIELGDVILNIAGIPTGAGPSGPVSGGPTNTPAVEAWKLGVETIRARLCDLLMKPEDDDVPSL